MLLSELLLDVSPSVQMYRSASPTFNHRNLYLSTSLTVLENYYPI
jgi:hypothetical protein